MNTEHTALNQFLARKAELDQRGYQTPADMADAILLHIYHKAQDKVLCKKYLCNPALSLYHPLVHRIIEEEF